MTTSECLTDSNILTSAGNAYVSQRHSKTVEEALFKTLSQCTMFRVLKSQGEPEYFYGGISYTNSGNSFFIRKDCLRPNCSICIRTSEVKTIVFNHNSVDILLDNKTWVSGTVERSYKIVKSDLSKLLFNDKNILHKESSNIYVVQLRLINASEQERFLFINNSACPFPKKLFYHRNPLSYAYEKFGNEIYIGIWDMKEEQFVSDTYLFPSQGSLDIFK